VSALRYRLLDAVLAHGLLPDAVRRAGSRWGAHTRERREARGGVGAQEDRLRALLGHMSTGPVAELPAKANEQHYELPTAFFEIVLGPRRKYSGCLWEAGVDDLAAAEEAMLARTCERAGVRDGMRILDLGCGWGSLSLWLAERYPAAEVVGVSNSHGQREWIEAERERRGLANLRVITADVNDFRPDGRFDRVLWPLAARGPRAPRGVAPVPALHAGDLGGRRRRPLAGQPLPPGAAGRRGGSGMNPEVRCT
jgi:cyclopropane-fatty-acyl-phospholipid synthase